MGVTPDLSLLQNLNKAETLPSEGTGSSKELENREEAPLGSEAQMCLEQLPEGPGQGPETEIEVGTEERGQPPGTEETAAENPNKEPQEKDSATSSEGGSERTAEGLLESGD